MDEWKGRAAERYWTAVHGHSKKIVVEGTTYLITVSNHHP